MILRLVRGVMPAAEDLTPILGLRERVTRTLRDIRGLESVTVGARATEPEGHEAIVASVWSDPETMLRATGTTGATGEDRFVTDRLGLPLETVGVSLFEIVDRTFTAIPTDAPASVRILRIRAPLHDEARLIGVLRGRQDRLVAMGAVASHLGIRMLTGQRAEALHLSVWPDAPASDDADAIDPLQAPDLADWRAELQLSTYRGVEIAPRIPDSVGVPYVVLDDRLRIVDLTASGAAALGLPMDELVGREVDDVRLLGPDGVARSPWPEMLEDGRVRGETEWAVSSVGVVRLHVLGRRDRPVPGRHLVMVRRTTEPAPTDAELDEVLATEFAGARS